MTEVTFIKATGGHAVGATLNTSPGAAAYLIESGLAEAVKAPEKPARKVASGQSKGEVGGASPAAGAPTAG